MYSVILDSSNQDLLVALAKEDALIDVVCYPAWQRQSELMVKEMENLFIKHNVDKSDIGDVIVSIGPGSYTGQSISRKILSTEDDGRVIYQDTNNTSSDFQVNDTPVVRRNGAGVPSWNTWYTAE